MEQLSAADFRAYRGNCFRLMTGTTAGGTDGYLELELVEVSEHSAAAADMFRAPFAVLFHGPLTPVMPQAIYRLEHERLGTYEFFIVPVGPADPAAPGQPATAMRYEVVFC
jgi:hypothetical protein